MADNTFSAILAAYRLHYLSRANMASTADQVVADIARIMRRLGSYGVRVESGEISGLTPSALLEWNNEMVSSGLAVTTRNKYVVLLNPFLRWAVDKAYLLDNPLPSQSPIYAVLTPAKLPKEDAVPEHLRKRKHFTVEEARRFIEEMPGRQKVRDRAIVALFLASGFRAEELCSLNIGDVCGEERDLIYLKRKGGEWKYAEVAEFCYEFIDAYLCTREDKDDLSAPLFLTSRGTRCNRKQLWKVLSYKERQLGLTSGLHIMRHTFNTEVSDKSSPEIARDLSNHKSLAITNRYIHTTHVQRKEAVNKIAWSDLKPS